MGSAPPRWLKTLLSAIWCGAVLLFAASRYNYQVAFLSEFFCWALFTSVIIHLCLRPSLNDAAAITLVAGGLVGIDHLLLKLPIAAPAVISLIGCSGFIILGVRVIWATQKERSVLLAGLVAALLFSASDWFASDLLRWTAALHPRSLDLYLLAFDGSLGFQPSFAVGSLFERWRVLASFSMFFYVALPLSLAIVYADQLRRNRKLALPIIIAFVAAGPTGIVFYNLFPATGPVHVLTSQFPLHPPASQELMNLLLEPIRVNAPRNAIPSLHMAWALLAWWWSRETGRVTRSIALTFVVFTVVSTLGTGEHYLVDLVVALPFAVMLQAAATWSLRTGLASKIAPVFVSALGTLAWLAMLRLAPHFFWISAAIPWLLIALTVFVVVIAERRYCRVPVSLVLNGAETISATAD